MMAIDLFSGAGGLSLGAKAAGIRVIQAVESDLYACETYRRNFPDVALYEGDIRAYQPPLLPTTGSIVFGGPPCQGFSTSNQRTRSKLNPINWMFKEFFRVVEEAVPEWVVFENVKGLLETEKGFFLKLIEQDLTELGYTFSWAVLNACNYSIPQVRSRIFVVANRTHKNFKFPKPNKTKMITVKEALNDLPIIENGANISLLSYSGAPSNYAKKLRGNLKECANNITSLNSDYVIERYKHIPQGGNWKDIPDNLMSNYKDKTRCHTGIYHRLRLDLPSVVLGNFRKNMLIHPVQDRGLSVREAARLQSFPDNFIFYGSIGFQQQQVGNAVPPMLAKVIFASL
jgi:DNA (cytosine-5)-methyltransferase 1